MKKKLGLRKSFDVEKNILEPKNIIWHDVFGYVKNWNGERGKPVNPEEIENIIKGQI